MGEDISGSECQNEDGRCVLHLDYVVIREMEKLLKIVSKRLKLRPAPGWNESGKLRR
jgi:hypothetical protein